MDDDWDDEDDDSPLWWVVVRDIFLVFSLFGTASEWITRDGWQHWAAYAVAFALAGFLFERARTLWRWAADRRNRPTIHP